MITKYEFEGKTYTSVWAVRQAIGKSKNVAFGPEPKEGREAFWAQFGVTYSEQQEPQRTPEQIEADEKAVALREAKRLRNAQVAAATVTIDDMVFEANQTSIDRMGNTIKGMEINGTDTVQWVLADDTVATVTLDHLKQAFGAGVAKINALWPTPYQSKSTKL